MAIRSELVSAFEGDLHWQHAALWLVPALAAGAIIYYIYLVTHPYPAFGAGLFLVIAEQVSQHGYRLPHTIPYYAEPVPFGYSPLMFYVIAFLQDATGIGGIALARLLPGFVAILYLIPFYFFVYELLDSRRVAGLATFLVAVSPPVLQWQISAGGVVRAPATLLMISGFYTGLRLFRDGGQRWLIASLVLFGLTVLTHPVYAVFFALSYILLWLSFSRTVGGLLDGAMVGFGGVALVAPWWMQVIRVHGIDLFTGAAGTHGGLGKQIPELVDLLASRILHVGPPGLDSVSQSGVLFNVRPHLFNLSSGGTVLLGVWLLFIVGAAVHVSVRDDFQASRRAFFLGGWLLISMTVVSKLRFSFLIGAIFISLVVFEHAIPALDRVTLPWVSRRYVSAVVLATVGIVGLTTGGLYVASQLDSHAGSTSQPQFIGDADHEAMTWVEANTHPDSTFVVMGDGAEWFPQQTHRRILIGPWGMEWLGNSAYQKHLRQFNEFSTCRHEACVTGVLLRSDLNPDYLYVPTTTYTVRGFENEPSPYLREELIQSSHYRLVYENEGVLIFAVDIDTLEATGATDIKTRNGKVDSTSIGNPGGGERPNGAESALGRNQPRTV